MRVKVQGRVHEASVFQIVEKDPDGKPRLLRVVYPEEKVSVENEPEFLVGFFERGLLAPSAKRHN
jgi:hypothetical protein